MSVFSTRMALEAHVIRDRAPMCTMFIGETILIGQYIKPKSQMSYVCYIGVFSVKQCHQNGGFKSTVECSECCTASCFELIGFFFFFFFLHEKLLQH